MRVRMVMVTILLVSMFFIGLNILLAWRVNVTLLVVINIVCWSLLHLTINLFIQRKKRLEENS